MTFEGLKAARADAADAAKQAGYRSSSFVPGNVNPPLVVVAPAEPFVTESNTYDATEFRCNFDLFLIVGNQVNKAMVDKLDRMIQDVIRYLGNWHVGQVNEPFVGVANGNKLYMTRIRINALFTLTTED